MQNRRSVRGALLHGAPIEMVVENGFDRTVGTGADFDGAVRRRLETPGAIRAGQPNDPQTGAKARHGRNAVLDDWGLEPLDAAARHDLLEILEERYGRRSTMITSQLPVDRWHEIIGDPTYADAILDRLVHNAHRIELAGESMRRTRGKQNPKA